MRPFKQVMSFSGNYPEKCPVRIWKRDMPHLIARSFNFQQLFFYEIFCATRILRVIGRQSIRQSTDFLLIFWHNKKTSKIKFIK